MIETPTDPTVCRCPLEAGTCPHSDPAECPFNATDEEEDES